jgi:hypothetical protein
MSVEAERQRLSSIAANEREHICREQSERAAEAEGLVAAAAANRATDEKDRRAVALAASRLADPTGLNMSSAPSGRDLYDFERDPEQSVLMMHALFGNDFLLTPSPRSMNEAEAQEYKDNLYEQCAVSEEARNTCISD